MDLYCTIFVSTDMNRSLLSDLIASLLEGEKAGLLINTGSMALEVIDNEDADSSKQQDPERGFLYYPFCLDIEPAEPIVESDYIRDIGKLLTALRSHGCKAVAACDFEDQLPPG